MDMRRRVRAGTMSPSWNEQNYLAQPNVKLVTEILKGGSGIEGTLFQEMFELETEDYDNFIDAVAMYPKFCNEYQELSATG